MTVFLDSWAWIAYLQDTKHADRIERYIRTGVITSSINIAEVLCFLLRHGQEDLVHSVKVSSTTFPVTDELAEEAARLKHKHKMGMADAIVLATARANNATIVTGDADFKSMENVVYLGK